MVAVLEELRMDGGQIATSQFGFLEIDLWSDSSSTLRIYKFDDPQYSEHGFENSVFQGDFQFLAGADSGATGQWRPAGGQDWGVVITQLPENPDGSTSAFATTHYFRPDGSPTWTSTRAGTNITSPNLRYQGTAWPLHRRGINLCLECSGAWSFDDTNLGGGVTVDIQAPLLATSGTSSLSIPLPAGADPAFPGGYGFSYSGTLVKVTD